jgi:hypothetical protein
MLEEIKPREQAGRDSFGRYKAQVRSAAIASLAILDGKAVDRIYCDLHDDFVLRLSIGAQYFYVFYQVKTHGKKNHNWTINEIFGLSTRIKDQNKQCNDQIKDSFAGKLLLHTVNFCDQCMAVVLQTNVHIDDSLDELVRDFESGKFANKYSEVIINRFNDCFISDKDKIITKDCAKKNLAKLKIETDVQYLKNGISNFEPIAKEKIYQYSEVDLHYDEVKEILLKLVDLVERKSSGIITEFTSESIDKAAGISIDDLLGILSISKDAYDSLANGGDPKALKSVSIIQRALISGGASLEQVNYCSSCKTAWDAWLRTNRHFVPEFDLQTIISGVRKVLHSNSATGFIEFGSLKKPIENLMGELKDDNLLHDLTKELVLGAIFSELVRGKS